MSKTFFCADTHFYDPNIILYESNRLNALVEYITANNLTNRFLSEVNNDNNDLKELIKDILINDFETKDIVLDYYSLMIIEKWNSVVSKDDFVYFLGDYTIDYNKGIKVGKLLNGHKTIILGNHDFIDRSNYNLDVERYFKECSFERVEFNPIILKNWFVLSHEPIEYINEYCPFFNIYGHVHSSELFQTSTKHSLCVCLDRHNFIPQECEIYNKCEK